MFGANVFGLLWGYPFLVADKGFHRGGLDPHHADDRHRDRRRTDHRRAVARYPYHRSWIVLSIVIAIMTCGRSCCSGGAGPMWLLVRSSSSPPAGTGLDGQLRPGRTFHRRNGSQATGVVNMGSFVASLGSMWLIDFISTSSRPAVATLPRRLG